MKAYLLGVIVSIEIKGGYYPLNQEVFLVYANSLRKAKQKVKDEYKERAGDLYKIKSIIITNLTIGLKEEE